MSRYSVSYASDRGVVAAIIGSSMYMDRTSFLNNTAEFGGIISACSEVTALDDEITSLRIQFIHFAHFITRARKRAGGLVSVYMSSKKKCN